jgi:hypothetical protein
MRSKCECDLRHRRWHPYTGKCETCDGAGVPFTADTVDDTEVKTGSATTAKQKTVSGSMAILHVRVGD